MNKVVVKELSDRPLPLPVRHRVLGFTGTAVRPERLDGLGSWAGVRVVWDEGVEVVNCAPGEEVWYPADALLVIEAGPWWVPNPIRRAWAWLGRFAELRGPLS